MTTSEVLLDALGQLPDEREGTWLLRLTQAVTTTPGAEPELARIYGDTSLEESVRFAAFYGYEILVRRKKDYSKFRAILRSDGVQFAGRPMYLCISALADQLGRDQVSDMKLALSKAEQALTRMPKNFVVQNQVAEYMANLAERTTVSEQELLRAVMLARDAAYASGYARYYQTLALAELACHNYQAAREAVGLAIDLEPSTGTDYALRVGDYNVVRVKIDVAESIQEVRSLHSNAIEEIRLLRSDMIQLLGILAAVIALISLSGQLAARVEFHDAAPPLSAHCSCSRMRVLSYASVKGDGAANEDIGGAAGSLAWIFDGATATGPPTIAGTGSDAEWLAHRLDTAIRDLTDDGTAATPLAELAAQLIDSVRKGLQDLGLPADQLTPYASGALLREIPGWVEYLVLGDVSVAYRAGEYTEVVTDPDAARLARAAIDLAARYQGEELRGKQQEFERLYVNQPEGYWVFGSHPAAAEHGVTGRFPMDEPGLVLLATDGFARVVEVFDLAPSWAALIDTLAAGAPAGVGSMIERLREAEADARHSDVARIKGSDDATALLLSIGAPG